jgi:magnesium chelatase accessory protein
MGSGPPLLLLHGTGASTHSFRALMPLLAERFTVVAPDLPGHAFSRAPSWFDPSLPAMASALQALLVALDVAPTVAVGHSAGAALLARMALDRTLSAPLLVGLGAALVPFRGVTGALFPPTARLLSMVSKVVALRVRDADSVERMLGSTGSHLDTAGIELYRRLSERPSHVAAVLAMMARWDLEPLFAELPRLHVRFLLVAGELDRAVPVSQQRAVVARTPGARLEIVPRTGHLLHEEQPEVVARLILDEVDATARANQDHARK